MESSIVAMSDLGHRDRYFSVRQQHCRSQRKSVYTVWYGENVEVARFNSYRGAEKATRTGKADALLEIILKKMGEMMTVDDSAMPDAVLKPPSTVTSSGSSFSKPIHFPDLFTAEGTPVDLEVMTSEMFEFDMTLEGIKEELERAQERCDQGPASIHLTGSTYVDFQQEAPSAVTSLCAEVVGLSLDP